MLLTFSIFDILIHDSRIWFELNFLRNGTSQHSRTHSWRTVLFSPALSVSDAPGWRTGNRIKISHSTRADSFSYYAGHHNGIALLDILPLVIPPSRLPLLLSHLARFARSRLAAANETAREQRRSNRATNVFTLSLPSTTKRDYLNASTGPTKSRCTLVTVYMAVGSVNCAYETLISRGQDVTGCALTTSYTGCSVKSNFASS